MNPTSTRLILLLSLSAVVGGGPAPAFAGGDGAGRTHTHDYLGSGTALRATPGHAPVLAHLRNDTTLSMRCWSDTRTSHTGNYTSRRWFAVSVGGLHPRAGWVHSSEVWDQTVVSQCWTELPTLDVRTWLTTCPGSSPPVDRPALERARRVEGEGC